MGKQPPFFMSEWEIFQKEHPERSVRKKGTSVRKKSTPKVYNCDTCGLSKNCRNPKIERFGEGRKKILIVGQCPGWVEDRDGRNFVGATGSLLRKSCGYLNIDLDIDCERTNVNRCYPGKNAKGRDITPTKDQIKCCVSNLEKDIQEVQPKLIICLGKSAIQAVLKSSAFSDAPTAELLHGKVFPYHKYNCWVGCSYHPSFFLHRKKKKDVPDDEIIFSYDLANIISYLDDPLPQPLTSEGNECITDVNEAVAILEHYCNSEKPVSFDYETNMLDSFQAAAKLLSTSITNEVESASFIPIGLKGVFTEEEQARIMIALKNFLKSDAPKICQNYYMEEMWGRNILGQPMNNFIHDTMVTAHVVNCHPRTTGLAYQAFEMTGHEYKHMVDPSKIEDEPLEKTCDYNCWDVRYPIMAYKRQKSRLTGRLGEFNEFFRKGLVTLANYKYRGIQIDEEMLNTLEEDFGTEIEGCRKAVEESDAAIKYNEDNEEPLIITKPARIGKLLYDICGVELTKERKTPKSGKGGTSKEVFAEILSTTKDDRVRRILSNVTTYRSSVKVLERIAEYRLVADPNWRIHPTFNLHIPRSYRSSSDGPNIQNVFKHNERQLIFRRCIVPGIGYIFLEPDYSGAEICVAAMISGDPVLTKQIIDGINVHRMWASRIFDLPEDKVTKAIRSDSKNGFFFPSIYGSTPESIARSLQLDGDFVKKVQGEFWEEYHFIKEWQQKTIHDYLKNGYVEMVTGARRPGPLNINKLYNTPIQGPSYHLLQDACNRVDDKLLERKLKTFAVAEIHDAIILNTHVDEWKEVIDLTDTIMCSKRFDWQREVPMSIEWDVGAKNWWDMHSLEMNQEGAFVKIDKDTKIKLEDFIINV